MTKLQIFEEDLLPGMQAIALLVENQELSKEALQKVALGIYRAGLFSGAKAVGAVIIEDKTNPKTFIQKLKYLFS